jgi:hypothetical protein
LLLHADSITNAPPIPTQPATAAATPCRRATGLSEFNIANNKIQGSIPDEVQNLRYLKLFNIYNTRMFCCGDGQRCTHPDDPACLPAFLSFENSLVSPPYNYGSSTRPNDTGANMK